MELSWLATGWEDFDSYLRKGHEWLGVLSDLPEDVASPCITAVSKLAIRRTGLVLAPLLTLLNGGPQIPMHMVTDTFPAETDIDGLPSWALGGHVRPGLQSFRKYIDQSAQMKRLIKVAALGDVSPAQIIAGLVFRLESGQLAHRMDWETGRRLKADATACGWGIPDEAVPDAMSILSSEFDILNECRAQAIRNYIR